LGRANGFDDADPRQGPTSRDKANCTVNRLTILRSHTTQHFNIGACVTGRLFYPHLAWLPF